VLEDYVMRIAISINGQGRGHLTRMTALGQILSLEHELIFWCPEKYHSELAEAFPESFIFPIPYYQFVLDGPKIDIIKTSLVNVEHLIGLPVYTSDLVDQLHLMDIDLVISDFEPFLPKAARKIGLPIIQLNHPAVVLRSLSFSPDALIAKVISTSMMGEYDIKIISSFYNGDIGPIIRKEITSAMPRQGDYYIVYLYHTMRDTVLEELDSIPGIKFRSFPNPDEDFVEALAGCRGVITNAGHQLLSEALHLKKPVLSIPMEGQYEQKLNAEMLVHSGQGRMGSIEHIRDNLPAFFHFVEQQFDPSKTPKLSNIKFRLRDDAASAVSLLNYHICKQKAVS